jgi:Zn-dependent protease
MDFDTLSNGAIWYLVFLFSTICHEASHALAAMRLGDPTASNQVTLNPLPHVRREPIGMILMPLLSYAAAGYVIGWASTPYSRAWANEYPRRAALMSLAGPMANFSLMLLAVAMVYGGLAVGVFAGPPSQVSFSHVVDGLGPQNQLLATLVSVLFSLNLMLAIFNLIPLPPLDGSGAIGLLMGEGLARSWREQRGRLRFIGLLLAWKVFGFAFGPIHLFAINLLYPGAHFH